MRRALVAALAAQHLPREERPAAGEPGAAYRVGPVGELPGAAPYRPGAVPAEAEAVERAARDDAPAAVLEVTPAAAPLPDPDEGLLLPFERRGRA